MSDGRPKERFQTSTAFFLWFACFLGLCGVHRLYLGKTGTGLLYLFTFGLFGVGQFIDLVRLRTLVSDENLKHEALQALAEKRSLQAGEPPRMLALPPAERAAELRVELARAASRHGGRLTIPQAVLETGRDFSVVEAALDEMVKGGYVDINNAESGAVVYVFSGLEQ